MALTEHGLLTPGPVNLHPAAAAVIARPQTHHRSRRAIQVISSLRRKLKELAAADGEVILIGGSGTASMEAAVRGLFRQGARLWIPVAGKFAGRWAEIAASAGMKPVLTEHEWGSAVSVNSLPEEPLDGALLTHSETSTGVLHPVHELSRAVKSQNDGAIVVVDAVTSFMLAELKLDAWNIDAAVSGSQKGVMSPPGLSWLWLSNRAVEVLRPAGYYLDVYRELKAQQKGQTAFTPPIQIIEAVDAVLTAELPGGIKDLPRRWERKARENHRFYSMGSEIGLRPVPNSNEHRSPATAAFYLPDSVRYDLLSTAFENAGWRIAGGQGKLKDRIFRVSAMGYFKPAELDRAYDDFLRIISHLV